MGRTLIVFVTVIFLMNGNSVFSQVDLDSGLIAYYPFDGDATDKGPSGLDGSVNGASLTQDRLGINDKAYYFNGKGNTITVDGLCAKVGGEIAISFWTWSDTCAVSSVFMAVPDDPYNRFSLHYNYNHNFQNAFVFDYGRYNGGGRIDSIPFQFTDEWTHVLVISSDAKDSMYMYINGKLVKKQKGHDTHSSDKVFSFGATTGFYYRGAIDEFRIYNRMLTRAEIDVLSFNETPTGVVLQKKNLDVSAFPNPSNSGNYNLISTTRLKSIAVYTAAGSMLMETNDINSVHTAIDLGNAKPGVYFAFVHDAEDRRSVIKLVKGAY
jgi:hypothetical protein